MTFRQLAFRNVFRNLRSYAAFLLASVFSVMVFFIYSMFIFHPLFEEEGFRVLAVRGMFIAEIVLYIFTLFFLFYSLSAFLQARTKEFGVLMHLGMSKKQLNKLVFFETMILGGLSTAAGIVFGFAFTKFFFMIGREIMQLEQLPLYFSWKPFVLTVGAFASLFIIISLISVSFIRTKRVVDLLEGFWKTEEEAAYSPALSAFGLVLLAIAYFLAATVSDRTVYIMVFIVPPLATIGTYLFFTHSIHTFLQLYKKRRSIYWHKTRLVSLAEAAVKLKDSAQMFFIVTIVSTVAFLTVGTLASFTSYTAEFRQSNPLGLIYVSFEGNALEQQQLGQLKRELEQQQLAYTLVPLEVKRQTSSASGNDVDIMSLSEFNRLAIALGHEPAELQAGEAMFVPFSQESLRELQKSYAETELLESGVELTIDQTYPQVLFPAHTLNANTIIMNNEDFGQVDEPLMGYPQGTSDFRYYAFHVPDWTETVSVGENVRYPVSEAMVSGNFTGLNYYFENPGYEYRWFKSSFALLLFIGLMVAAVFLLAAGSFIYFKLYTGLERDRRQYQLMVRLGMTQRELGRIVNRQLVPLFFLPWALALLHSAFAFISLQVVWDEFAELSILFEMSIVLGGFTLMQILYFFLIRWRYIAHLKAS